MFKSLPSWIVIPALEQESVQALGFNNGSVIKAVPTNEDAGRSEALSLLVVDEAAHVQKMDELWLGLYPTLSAGGRCILLSTPAGVGNQFHKLWDEAEKKINDFNTIKLPWDVHPERDEEWFKKETRAMEPRAIAQELLCSFEASGHSYLTTEDIDWIGTTVRSPVERSGPRWNFWVWDYPVPGRKYIIAADACRGDSEDFAAFQVIDMEKDCVVGEYRDKIFPDRFADFLAEVGHRFNDALICVELNTYGMMTTRRLKMDLKYPNLYYEDLMKNPYGLNIELSDDDETLPGFTMTSKSRPQVLAKLEEMIRNRRLGIYSTRLYDELKTFIVGNGGKIQAMRGYNDDLIMSLSIGCWIYDMAEGYSKQSEGLGQAMLAGMSKSSTVFHSQGWSGNGGYSMPIMPMSFQRRNSTDPIVQGTQQKVPPGFDKLAAERNAMLYGEFGWVLDDPKTKKE